LSESLIVDASVAFAWVYPSQSSKETSLLLEEIEAGIRVVVPPLWFLEIANGLLAAQRRRLITVTEGKTALDKLSGLRFTVDDAAAETTFRTASDLAEKYGLSVYDAVYLETALRRKLTVASRDKALRTAAKRCGLKIRN
jgi:predicted nucleic acid-binding protein